MSENVVRHPGLVDKASRSEVTGGEGCTLLLTGLSGSGKSTIAHAVERALIENGRAAYVLDGDNVRLGLNADLSFSPEDRAENVRRVTEVARLFADAGVVALVPVIAPYQADRDAARGRHETSHTRYLEVYVDTPLEVCERRDPKGLYTKARAGEIKDMTGIDSPYEAPGRPDLQINGEHIPTEDAVMQILRLLG